MVVLIMLLLHLPMLQKYHESWWSVSYSLEKRDILCVRDESYEFRGKPELTGFTFDSFIEQDEDPSIRSITE